MTQSPVSEQRFEAQRPLKLAERVAKTLLDQITEAGLQPGESLPNERDMIESFGVARGTVREALRLLETQGVIGIKPGPGGGPYVMAPTADIFAGSTTMLMQFLGITFREVIDTRVAFEPPVAAAAAAARTEEQLDVLTWHVDQMHALIADPDGFRSHYHDFHVLLSESTGNRVMLMTNVVFRTIWTNIHQQFNARPADRRTTERELRRLVEAVANQDAPEAYAASYDYLIRYRTWIERWHPNLFSQTVIWTPAG